MPEIFFTADSHFGHANILRHEPATRPFSSVEEHDDALVERWNAVVKPKDTVWHLGDLIWRATDLQTVGRLNGHIKLVLGNHDLLASAKYLQVVNKLYGVVEFQDKVILSHFPLHPVELLTPSTVNLHGHLHSKKLDDPLYCNVGVDRWDLAPVSWDVLRSLLEAEKVTR